MKRDLALWTGFLGGPLIWLASFGARWSLSGVVCAYQWGAALFVIAFVAVLLTACTGLLSWNEWQRVGRQMPGEAGGAIPRSRIMALFGVALSALSILLILAQAVPELILGVCQ
jgi:hypothetical protein